MDALEALLGADLDVKKEVFIKRLDTHFTIQPLSTAKMTALREQATHFVGKGKNRKKELDTEKFNGLLIASGVANPDFNNADLKKKYGAHDGSEVVQKALLAGEAITLQDEILRLSGFEDDDDAIDEIKN